MVVFSSGLNVVGNYSLLTDGLKIQTLTEQSQYDETVNRVQALRGHGRPFDSVTK